jgi:hypothetical protein
VVSAMIHAFQNSYVGLEGRAIDGVLQELLGAYRRQVIDLHDIFKLHRSLKNDLYAIDVILGRVDDIA